MNLFPFCMAIRAPRIPPIALLAAIGMATSQMIFPFRVNNTMDPRLVARFTSFAYAEARKKIKSQQRNKGKDQEASGAWSDETIVKTNHNADQHCIAKGKSIWNMFGYMQAKILS